MSINKERRKARYTSTGERLARLHARGFPPWLIRYVNEIVLAALGTDLDQVPITWLVHPGRRDRKIVGLRWYVIDRLRREVVQRRDGTDKLAFRLRSGLTPAAIADDHWQPISHPSIGELLGMDHSTITLAVRKNRHEVLAAGGQGGENGQDVTAGGHE